MHPEIILIFHLYEESFIGMMSESEPGSLPSFPINLCSESDRILFLPSFLQQKYKWYCNSISK